MPMAPVSPSPLTPIAISFLFASIAPVPTDGMRPCTALKPCELPRKYAGLLLEQPMPDSLMTWLGIDAHLEERVDDALGDRVVAAAGAERRLAALVDLRFESDSIHFDVVSPFDPDLDPHPSIHSPPACPRAGARGPSSSPLRSLPAPARRR